MRASSLTYRDFHHALRNLYGIDDAPVETQNFASLQQQSSAPQYNPSVWKRLARWLYNKRDYKPEYLAEPEPLAAINETYNILNKPLQDLSIKQEIPPELTAALEQNTFYFSGFKTHHELQEAASQLLKDADGNFKPFQRFLKDIETIDKQYNKTYLRAEYNFATASTQMAVKWKEWEADGDDYDLQYRTAGDDRVREEHAALNGTTLPPSDPFWNSYLPPNGWNCRCTTVQVRKGKYPQSNSEQAIARGNACTEKPKQQIFRFNPGKQKKIFPPKHPIFPKGCGVCPFNDAKELSAGCRRNDCGDCKKVPFKNKSYDITEKLKELLELKGKNYNKKLQEICSLKMFKPIPGMKGVYWTGNEGDNDMDRLKLAAQKAVLFGNKVYIMPNPNKTPTLDFIFVRKGIYKGYDLKSVDGKNSVGDRLTESVRQTHRVLLNMCVDYDTRSLAKEIKKHFNNNKDVIEVLIYKGRTSTSVDRYKAESKKFIDSFVTEYKSQKR